MKKIGVVTITDNNNYGNRLQCYAVQRFITKSLNIYTESINNYKGNQTKKNIKKLIKTLLNYKNQKQKNKRYKMFKEFNKNIKISRYIIKNGKVNKKIEDEYNYFITGSDQVWNPTFAGQQFYYLDFSKNTPKISFSASIGTTDLTTKDKEKIKNNLNDFKFISVREQSAKEIIEKLAKRNDVEVLIDPTMLLTSEEWDKVSKKPSQLKNIKEGKYILNYFLGELSQSRKQEIERIAKKNNCHIINILDKEDPFYTCGPSEFLYLEKNAFLICTDSFHSSVFAILYNKPFIIFDREDKAVNMNTRIDTLLSKFKLENRRFNGKEITKENLNHDYTEAYKILEKERKKSEEFLKKALDIE